MASPETTTDFSAASADPLIGRELICPRCGYDLRAATADRCSECGLVIDRASMSESGIPWAHRAKLGLRTAFFQTVRQFTGSSRGLRHEASRPQSVQEARIFARCNAVFIAVGLFSVGIALLSVPFHFLIEEISSMKSSEQWKLDVEIHWSVGFGLSPRFVGLICSLGYARYLAGVGRRVLHLPAGTPPSQAEAAEAIGYYSSAPLFWLAPTGLILLALFEWTQLRESSRIGVSTGLSIAAAGLIVVALVATVFQVGFWRSRCRRSGLASTIYGMSSLLVRWVVGWAVFWWLFPWCIGFVWLVWDSSQ